jgi:hypothetical protein
LAEEERQREALAREARARAEAVAAREAGLARVLEAALADLSLDDLRALQRTPDIFAVALGNVVKAKAAAADRRARLAELPKVIATVKEQASASRKAAEQSAREPDRGGYVALHVRDAERMEQSLEDLEAELAVLKKSG